MTDPLFDVARPRPVLASRLLHEGRIWDLRSDDVDLGEAGVVTREWIDHPGAVATIAVDSEGRVLLLRQFRHPVGRELWEPPAGLLDVVGEDALLAAQRELAEEADLRADTWHVLADYFTTPGGNNEALRVYLARDLSPVPEDERHVREDEEMSMVPAWVSLEEAVDRAGVSATARLTAAIDAYVGFNVERSIASLIGISEIPYLTSDRRRGVVQARHRTEQVFKGIIADGVETGEFATPYGNAASRSLVTMLAGMSLWYRPGGVLSRADLAQQQTSFGLAIVEAR